MLYHGTVLPCWITIYSQAEMEEQRAKEAEERIEAEERARIAKRPRHDELDLKALLDDEDLDVVTSFSSELQSIAQNSRPINVPEDSDIFVYEDNKEDDRAVADLRKKLKGLKIVSRAKVTQDRVYSAAYHPEPTKDLIFFGGGFISRTSQELWPNILCRQAWSTWCLGRKGYQRRGR